MRPIRLAALTLLGSALLTVTGASGPAEVFAQDAGEKSAAPAGPKIEETIRFTDRKSLTEVQLPRDWKSGKVSTEGHELARWEWAPNGSAIAGVTTFQVPGAMRAALYRYQRAGRNEVVDGSVKSGEGASEHRVIDERGISISERFVEKDGILWGVRFFCHKNSWELCQPVADATLASFKVPGTYKRKSVADGWAKGKVKDFVVRTNVDKDDVDAAVAMVEEFVDMRKWAIKALPGKPFVEGPWHVYVILSGKLYDTTATANTGEAPEVATYDPVEHALLVKWMSRKTAAYSQNIMARVSDQSILEHFGGRPPLWVDLGLWTYIEYLWQDKGKATKPDKSRMTDFMKPMIADSTRRLDQWFDLQRSDIPDVFFAGDELYAWHWFFRHAKQGKPWRKPYDSYMDILRVTGDPDAADAAWEGTDFEEMRDAFKKWGRTL